MISNYVCYSAYVRLHRFLVSLGVQLPIETCLASDFFGQYYDKVNKRIKRRKSSDVTSVAFDEAVIRVLGLDPADISALNDYKVSHRFSLADKAWNDKPLSEIVPIVNAKYLSLIRQLSTDDLEFVLETHNNNILRREPVTIQTILTELTRRGLIDDFSWSEDEEM